MEQTKTQKVINNDNDSFKDYRVWIEKYDKADYQNNVVKGKCTDCNTVFVWNRKMRGALKGATCPDCGKELDRTKSDIKGCYWTIL